MRVKCSRCGKMMSNDEFNLHKCANKRDLKNIPDELLLKIIENKITEEEAWKIIDN